MLALLQADVRTRVPHEGERDGEARDGDEQRADPDDLTGRVGRRERARGERHQRHADVARRLVQAERQPAPRRTHQIDLHHHGHRPCKALVDAEEQVGDDDPVPRRREADQQRHGQRQRPADDQHPPARVPLGKAAGEEVRDRLAEAEGEDEGQDRGLRREAELALADQRHHAALKAHHRTNERVQRDEQGELQRVGAQPEPNLRHQRAPRLAPSTTRAVSGARSAPRRPGRPHDR